MRLQAYAGASAALAAGVVLYAFNQRANFYSACVYLSQSNLCLMILTNLILFIIASFMFGMQRIFYGPLRPIEIEQLYEKAWFAVTETCLAMTIFREEVGAWFLIMFVALLVGKVWGWIGEGRVEVLEQQPPANPRLFHMRLSFSLGLSLVYDIWLMWYTINTVIQQARPNMMVMYLFEFAILTTSSVSTALRYGISLVEARITTKQVKERLEARRLEVRAEREQILAERAAVAAGVASVPEGEAVAQEPAERPLPSGDEAVTQEPAERPLPPGDEAIAQEPDERPLPSEDDVDEMDIEVPGWDAKGQWVLSLDLATDFLKLGIYSVFFFILLTFYGLPLHIMRDLLLTARSFVKRLSAFIRYRRATRDMNTRYPDATEEEIQREDTCIICREDMRAWSVTNPVGGDPPASQNLNERSRPKKLPCGHVLHLGCLRSWLERQQVCPTCRRSVVGPPHGGPNRYGGAAPPVPGQPAAPDNGAPAARPEARNNVRVFGLGPLRLAFGQGNVREVAAGMDAARAAPEQPDGAPGPRTFGLQLGFGRNRGVQNDAVPPAQPTSIQAQLGQLHQQIGQELRDLQVDHHELRIITALYQELNRLRQLQSQNAQAPPASSNTTNAPGTTPTPTTSGTQASFTPAQTQAQANLLQRHTTLPGISSIPAGHPDLPPGITLPEGWSLLPLTRLVGSTPPPAFGQSVQPMQHPVPQPATQAETVTWQQAMDRAQAMAPQMAEQATAQLPNSLAQSQLINAAQNLAQNGTQNTPGALQARVGTPPLPPPFRNMSPRTQVNGLVPPPAPIDLRRFGPEPPSVGTPPLPQTETRSPLIGNDSNTTTTTPSELPSTPQQIQASAPILSNEPVVHSAVPSEPVREPTLGVSSGFEPGAGSPNDVAPVVPNWGAQQHNFGEFSRGAVPEQNGTNGDIARETATSVMKETRERGSEYGNDAVPVENGSSREAEQDDKSKGKAATVDDAVDEEG